MDVRCINCAQALRPCRAGTAICAGAGWTHASTDSHFCDFDREAGTFGTRLAWPPVKRRVKRLELPLAGIAD